MKYIFKYLLKGPDHISYKIGPLKDDDNAKDKGKRKRSEVAPQNDANKKKREGSNEKKKRRTNEVSDFREARWWATPEAFWKIAGFTVHKQMPPVTRLPVHLQHQQNVFGDFNDMQPEELRALAEKTERSQLQQWFALNKRELRNPGGYEEGTAAPDLLYRNPSLLPLGSGNTSVDSTKEYF